MEFWRTAYGRRTWLGCLLLSAVAFAAGRPAIDVGENEELKDQASFFENDEFRVLMRALDRGSNAIQPGKPSLPTQLTRGRIEDAQGRPVAAACMALDVPRWYAGELHKSNLDITDDQGRFFLEGTGSQRRLFLQLGDSFWAIDLERGQSEITLRLPPHATVSVRLPEELKLASPTIYLQGRQLDARNGFPFGRIQKELTAEGRAEIDLMPGEYLVSGNILDQNGRRHFVELGHLQLAGGEKSQLVLGERSGVSVKGMLPGLQERLKAIQAEAAVLSLIKPQIRDQSEYRVIERVTLDESGHFELSSIPAGRYLLRIDGFYGDDVPRQRRAENPLLLKQRCQIGQSDIDLGDLTEQTGDPTVLAVHRTLDSEHPNPMTMSWSWTDVQRSQLLRHEDRKGVVNELLRLLDHDQTPWSWRYLIIDTLGAMEPPEPQILARMLRAARRPANERWRSSMLASIGKMGASAAPVVGELLEYQRDRNWRVRYAIVRTLGSIARDSESPDPRISASLIKSLEDPHGLVRYEAAGTIGSLKLNDAAPVLRQALQDPYGKVRAYGAWALWQITGESQPSVEILIALLEGDDWESRKEAAYLLERLGPAAKPAQAALVKLTEFPGKPPFRDRTELLKYQTRSCAERALKAIDGEQ